MAIKGNHYIEIKFPKGKDYAIEYLSNKVLEYSPKHTPFKLYEIKNQINLSDLEIRQFNHLITDIRNYLIESGNVLVTPHNRLKMIIKKEQIKQEVNQTINMRDNYGNQGSFSNSPITANIHPNPKTKEDKSIFVKIWKLVSNNKLITGLILIAISTFIEEITVGVIWKYIKSF